MHFISTAVTFRCPRVCIRLQKVHYRVNVHILCNDDLWIFKCLNAHLGACGSDGLCKCMCVCVGVCACCIRLSVSP